MHSRYLEAMKMPQILTTKEVAEYLKLHEITVCKYAAEGKIPAIRIGRVWRFVFLKRIDRAAFLLVDPDSNKLQTSFPN
jgi:excisionase family DNA binding protein